MAVEDKIFDIIDKIITKPFHLVCFGFTFLGGLFLKLGWLKIIALLIISLGFANYFIRVC